MNKRKPTGPAAPEAEQVDRDVAKAASVPSGPIPGHKDKSRGKS